MGETRNRAVSTGWRLGGVLASTLLLGFLVAVIPALPADAAPPRCPCRAGSGQSTCREPSGAIRLCVREDDNGEDDDDSGDDDDNDDGGSPNPGPQTWCPPRHWVTTAYDGVPAHLRPYEWDDVYREHPDAIFQYDVCTCPGSASGFCPGVTTRWFLPAEAPPLPDPEDVAADRWADLQATLEPPALSTYPPVLDDTDAEEIPPACSQSADVCARVNLPTFVAVTNWQGTINDPPVCDPSGVVCVAITAVPTLTWDPGEDLGRGRHAPTITCEDGGTRYVSGNRSAEEQAAEPGACAHTYSRRTGVDNRASTWSGAVTITWEATWETTSGPVTDSGSFGAVSNSTDLPVSVVEIDTTVYDDFTRGSES